MPPYGGKQWQTVSLESCPGIRRERCSKIEPNCQRRECIVLDRRESAVEDVIIYTGHGGNIPRTATQYQDQELDRQNMALVISGENRLPVRVVRGSKHKSPWSPEAELSMVGCTG